VNAPTTAEWIVGLRHLADWLEQNPDVRMCRYGVTVSVEFHERLALQTVDHVRAFAAAHEFDLEVSLAEELDEGTWVRDAECRREFGPITVIGKGHTLLEAPVRRLP
jgi:hypothetical protein